MIHHRYTLAALGYPVIDAIDESAATAACSYAYAVTFSGPKPAQVTVAVWVDGSWLGHFKVTDFTNGGGSVEKLSEPVCFQPLPCPKPTPAVTAPTFASCDPAAQQVAFMALESRARALGLEAEEHRSVGHDELADILVGQQGACAAALDVLKGVAR